ncbi:MAG TPA: hypothetical protein VHR47_00870 [Bacillota bacterium]|nr:hypothetical protein [Bacillota bacterium]
MVDETLHGVSLEVQEQLVRGILGKRSNWAEFNRLNRKMSGVLRSVGLTLDRPTRRPFGLPVDQPEKNVLKLLSIYLPDENNGIDLGTLFPLSHRKLGLKEVIRYLRGLYEKQAYPEFEVEFGFVLAQLSFLTLPTWRTGGMGLSFLWRMGWEPLRQVASIPVGLLPYWPKKEARPLEVSFSSGIYLDRVGVSRIDRALRGEERETLIRIAIAKQVPPSEFEPALDMIAEAVYFAREYGCGLIEATGLLDEDTMITPV